MRISHEDKTPTTAETRPPLRLPLAELEARQLKNADPRIEWRQKARAYLTDAPDASFGDIADHLGISVLDTVAALHGLESR